ncbi:MAG: hypothetical protein QM725_00115 [Lacibacter sp.]
MCPCLPALKRIHPAVKVSFLFLIGLFFCHQSNAQAFVGAGIGSENLHLTPGRAIAPDLSFQYVADNRRTAFYFDVAGWKRSDVNETSVIDDLGNVILVKEMYKYTHLCMQSGVKKYFNGDFDEDKILIFGGGGFSDYLTFNKYTANSAGTQTIISANDKYRSNALAMHFTGGLSRHFSLLTVELNTGLDFIFKGVSELSGTSNVHTHARLKLLCPL